jgi:dTDP-4-dehydrorhamnose reductase
LSRNDEINGYTKAIFSGFPTNALAEIIRDNFILKPNMHGLFHVSSKPISKYDLLKLVAKTYGKEININKSEELIVDRSLSHNKLKNITGFSPDNWKTLIQSMKSFYEKYYN